MLPQVHYRSTYLTSQSKTVNNERILPCRETTYGRLEEPGDFRTLGDTEDSPETRKSPLSDRTCLSEV